MSVCVCTRVWFSCVNLCRCLLVVSAGLLGKDQPKEWFFIMKKMSNRFGRNRYIYKKKKKCIPFLNENLFFREKYTCVLLFLGCFFLSHVSWVWAGNVIGEFSLITVFIWLFGCCMRSRDSWGLQQNHPPIWWEDASWISVVYPRVAPTLANSVDRFSSAPSYISN